MSTHDDRGWNDYAANFEHEVLNVVGHDTGGLIKTALHRYVRKKSAVGDFGCGIGWGIPLLTKRATHVYAIDIADSFLDVARKRRDKNVTWIQWDLARKKQPPIPKLDAILSLQVLITGEDKIRTGIIKTFARSLKRGGHLILTVPSLESQLWSYRNSYRYTKNSKSKAGRAKTKKMIAGETQRLTEGLVRLDNFDTKFYLGPEIEADLRSHGFDVLQGEQLPYCWSEELMPADWPAEPKPWNWLVVARKL